jgi:hypothetical protein
LVAGVAAAAVIVADDLDAAYPTIMREIKPTDK